MHHLSAQALVAMVVVLFFSLVISLALHATRLLVLQSLIRRGYAKKDDLTRSLTLSSSSYRLSVRWSVTEFRRRPWLSRTISGRVIALSFLDDSKIGISDSFRSDVEFPKQTTTMTRENLLMPSVLYSPKDFVFRESANLTSNLRPSMVLAQ